MFPSEKKSSRRRRRTFGNEGADAESLTECRSAGLRWYKIINVQLQTNNRLVSGNDRRKCSYGSIRPSFLVWAEELDQAIGVTFVSCATPP